MKTSFAVLNPTTTGAGIAPSRRGVVLAGLAIVVGSFTSASPAWCQPFDGTSAAPPTFARGEAAESSAEATAGGRLGDAKRLSGLTWDELSRVMGATRRTLHLWANGRAISSANERRLSRLVGVLQVINRGTGRETRQALLTPLKDGVVPFDLLVLGKFDDVMARFEDRRLSSSRLAPPTAAMRASRQAPSPIVLLDAAQDPIGTSQLALRPGKVVRRPVQRT